MLIVNANNHAMFFATNMSKLSENGEWEVVLGKCTIKISKSINDPNVDENK